MMRALAFSIGALVLALDWVSKHWIMNTPGFSAYRGYPVVEGFFRIKLVRNEGIAFGLFHSVDSEWKPLILGGMAVVAVLCVLFYIWTTPLAERRLFLPLGLLLGGILGNFVDRLLHSYVVDFLELHWRDSFTWPTFNVADMAITCGVFLILYETFVRGESREQKEAKTPEGAATGE